MADNEQTVDPFDKLYSKWATFALVKRRDAPSRERWDAIVMFLLTSRDPARQERYVDVASGKGESLGSDAYKLWLEMPDDAPNRTAPARTNKELAEYEKAHLGSMRAVMEARGLGERYNSIVTGQVAFDTARSQRARKAQTSVLIMGCAGIGAIILMMLAVLLIIGVQLMGK
jgi:hypothetical protein